MADPETTLRWINPWSAGALIRTPETPPSTVLPRKMKVSVSAAKSAAEWYTPDTVLPSAVSPSELPLKLPPLGVAARAKVLDVVTGDAAVSVGQAEPVRGFERTNWEKRRQSVAQRQWPEKLMPRFIGPETRLPRTRVSAERRLKAMPLSCLSRQTPLPALIADGVGLTRCAGIERAALAHAAVHDGGSPR